jgi:hypothetical protein
MSHKEQVLHLHAKLQPWQEAIGTVKSIETFMDNVVISIFTGGGFNLARTRRHIAVEIPLIELVKGNLDLVQLIGQNISILRTDESYILQSKPDDDTRSKVH